MLGFWWRQVSVGLAGILLALSFYSAVNSVQSKSQTNSLFETPTALICQTPSDKLFSTKTSHDILYSPAYEMTEKKFLTEIDFSSQPTDIEVRETLQPPITITAAITTPTLALQKLVQTTTLRPTPTLAILSLNRAVNTYRNDHYLPSLNSQSGLCQIASKRIEEIAHSFNHDGFERRMVDGTLSGLGLTAWAENIWGGDGTITTTIHSWDQSEGHKQNMLGTWVYGCGVWNKGLAVYEFGR